MVACVGCFQLGTVLGFTGCAGFAGAEAVEAGVAYAAYAYAVADGEGGGDLSANTCDFADEFVADADGVIGCALTCV